MLLPPIPVSNYATLLAGEAVARRIKRYAPVSAATGRDTRFKGSGAFVLTDDVKWSQVWDRHIENEAVGNVGGVRNLNPAPNVDFEANLVVVLLPGPTPGVVGYRVVNGFIVGKQATLRLAPILANDSTTKVAVPAPWVFLVLPRTPATVKIELLGRSGYEIVATVPPSL